MNFKSIALALCAFVSTCSAQNLNVLVQDASGNAVDGAAITLIQMASVQVQSTDGAGKAQFAPLANITFTVAVSKSGYDKLTFNRTISSAREFGTARVVLQRPAAGTSYVAEWRLGSTSQNEDPEQDRARFDFAVKYYRDGSAIAGATIAITKGGAAYKTLTTEADGTASCLVSEGTHLSVKVTADGYAEYNTTLQPGGSATTRHVSIRMRKSN